MTNVDSHPGDAVAGAFPSWGPVSIGGITSKLLVAAILINFSVSSMALSALGIPYDWTDGSAFAKLHPSTYLSAVALAAYLMGQLRAGASLRGLAICFPGAAYFACFWMLLAIYGVVVQKTPLTSIIEPYLLAISALLMIDKLDPALQSFVRAFLHALIAVNALVGVFEYLTHLRLIPYVISGTPVIGDPRATAIIGHPLLNAATTGAYILCLLMGADARLSTGSRWALILVASAGMVAFGGRTAIVASLLVAGVLALHGLTLVLMGQRFSLGRLIMALLAAQIAIAGAVGAASRGLFDALAMRFIDDNGSAESRVIVWRLFDMFETRDLLLGPRQDQLAAALKHLGLMIGIENTWLALAFQYGELMTLFFAIGLFLLFWEFWRRTRSGGTLLFIYFLIVISSAVGLASKTMIFAQFAVLLLFLFERNADDQQFEANSTPPKQRR